ncbi:sulfite exporter TauE/SafE family protein [Enemella evansiae]|uniref:sulfite exporter TauE/SafE family protein n=1 Tax=Enemella evansiae TaxID=2016499 RepID=UPI000B972836|nr:sulfite exporter TauE/SafE family protein [Enemella evansiae]OYO05381.1 permease [Enemella evansiae]
MKKLIVVGLVGLGAQLIDGALGMGYGVTSTTLLLIAGLSPAAASASVHLAEMGTNIASGVSHHKLGNTDWRLVLRLGVPGAIGAFAGATFLSKLSTEGAEPVMAIILGLLGLYILVRFALRPPAQSRARVSPHRGRFLAPLGVVGGFVDATGGGGWGPVTTTSLLSAGKTAPRTVVGSVDTSEFLVSASASLGFLIGLGTAGINLGFVAALLIGGLIAAPIAAMLVSKLPARVLGTAVGGLILLTNLRTLLKAFDIEGATSTVALIAVAVLWVVAVVVAIGKHRRNPQPASEPESELASR